MKIVGIERDKKLGKDKRLLVLRFSALGDVAMTIPVVYSLALQYPHLQIIFATTPFFSRLFLNKPENLEVLSIDLKNEFHGVGGLLRLFRRLRKLKPDIVADLHNVGRTWMLDILFRFYGVKVRMVDKMRRSRAEVLKNKKKQPPFIERYADVFAALGFPIKLNFKSLFEKCEPELPFKPVHPSIGIAPFARYKNKAYPLDLIEKTVAQLSSWGWHVYLFGARGEEALHLEKIAGEMEGVSSIAGKYSIEQELALMTGMDLMVSMDSANHHLASLAGTECISIWGSTTPACGFMAYGRSPDDALVARLHCQPCTIAGSNNCRYGDFRCLRQISPLQITDILMTKLNSK